MSENPLQLESSAVEAEVIDHDANPVEAEDTSKPVSDSDWMIGTRSCRAGLRRMLSRLAPDWSKIPPERQPEYIKFVPSMRNMPYVRPGDAVGAARYDKRRMVDEIADRVMHIMFCGSDENALKAAKLIFESVDPPMKQVMGVEVTGAKLLVVPSDVADAI